jgi:hypothetical protein
MFPPPAVCAINACGENMQKMKANAPIQSWAPRKRKLWECMRWVVALMFFAAMVSDRSTEKHKRAIPSDSETI